MEAEDYERRAKKALSLIAMLNFHLRLNPTEIPALRTQINGMRNMLRTILDDPTDSAMTSLENQIDNALSALKPTGTTAVN